MRPGTKPQRAALKVLRGNPGKRRVPTNEPQGVGTLDIPPAWMDEQQRDQWFYSLQNAPPGMLTATDREILAVWVVACVEHSRAVVEVRRLGQVVKTKDGNVVNNPHLGIANRQAFIMIRTAAELGFTPSARASLGMIEESWRDGPRLIGEPNPFDEFRTP
jgi:P27 family predicted phage terminase small subunit